MACTKWKCIVCVGKEYRVGDREGEREMGERGDGQKGRSTDRQRRLIIRNMAAEYEDYKQNGDALFLYIGQAHPC